jgi:hypothetical protein
VIGLGAYLALLFAFYRRASVVLKRGTEPIDRVLALGLIGATVCLFLLDVTGTRFRNGDIMAFYWILAGMACNAKLTPVAAAHVPGVTQVPLLGPRAATG